METHVKVSAVKVAYASHYIIGNTHATHSIWLNTITILFHIYFLNILKLQCIFHLFKHYSLMLAFKRIWKFCIAQVRMFFKNESIKVCLNLFLLFIFIPVICFNYIALLSDHWFIPTCNKSIPLIKGDRVWLILPSLRIITGGIRCFCISGYNKRLKCFRW